MTDLPAATLGLIEFVRESNRIEGITRDPTTDEILASERFLHLFQLGLASLGELQAVLAPGKPLRDQHGMDVRIGDYLPPAGGPNIPQRLRSLLSRCNRGADTYDTHLNYESLHPYMDGNGRTGRMIWAWQMRNHGLNPFKRTFLHEFYYQALRKSR